MQLHTHSCGLVWWLLSVASATLGVLGGGWSFSSYCVSLDVLYNRWRVWRKGFKNKLKVPIIRYPLSLLLHAAQDSGELCFKASWLTPLFDVWESSEYMGILILFHQLHLSGMKCTGGKLYWWWFPLKSVGGLGVEGMAERLSKARGVVDRLKL